MSSVNRAPTTARKTPRPTLALETGARPLPGMSLIWQISRHAVVVGPAIDHWQIGAPVSMGGWCLRRLPFQRRRTPRVAAGRFAPEQAPTEIEEKQHLDGANDQRGDGNELVQRMSRWRNERRLAEFVIAARHS